MTPLVRYVPLAATILAAFGTLAQAQAPAPPHRPAPDAYIVRIEYGSSSGMCTGYCQQETIVTPQAVRTLSRTNLAFSGYRDRRHPDLKSRQKITAEQWQRAQAAISTDSLFSLPETIGCPGCVDEPVDWIAVEYSDGTKKSVTCNMGGPATDIADKVRAALAPRPGNDQRPTSH
jgi:hypothetical protein